jgi:hypothetical protein
VTELDDRYVLCGGVHRDGRRRLVAAFGCEAEARNAFVALRLQSRDERDWAELVAVDGTGKLRRICWFGLEGAHSEQAVPTARAATGRRWLWPLRRSGQLSAARVPSGKGRQTKGWPAR